MSSKTKPIPDGYHSITPYLIVKGAAAAIIITAGFGHGPGSLAEAAEWTARTTGLRPVGPIASPSLTA